jgi:zinc protease
VASAADATERSGADSAPTVTRLPNGLTVMIKRDTRFPLVSLRLYVHAGSAYEAAQEAGISHLLEHMVFKGTSRRPKGQVASDVEMTGGYLNAATSFDYTVYLTDMTRDHWKTGLDVLRDMAFNATLDPAELESEKDVVVSELKRGEDEPGQRLFRMIQRAALRDTPYHDPIIGYEKTVRAVTSQDMRDYIARLYQPQSMLLLICGDVSPDEALAEAERQFGDLTNNNAVWPPEPLDTTAWEREPTVTVEEGPWNKVYFSLSFPVPGMSDNRSAQLDVLAQILGGDASSRLYRTYKYEKRLVDAISVSNYSFERLGLLTVNATLDADKLGAFWEALSKELAGLGKTSFSKEELDRAKLNLEDDLFRSRETLAGYTSKLGYFAFFGRGEADEANFLRAVQDTDQEVLLSLIRQCMQPEHANLVALMPKNSPQPKGVAANTSDDPFAAWTRWFERDLKKQRAAATRAGQGDATATGRGEPERIDLGQGRTLVLIPDDTLPYTAVDMLFKGGDSMLEAKNQGLAAFTASLLTKGTKKLSAPALEDFLSDRAASFSAAAGRQSFSISMNFPARFTGDMFSLLRSTLVTPAMKEEEAARVRQNQIAAITAKEDRPTALDFRRMFPFFFGEHPYGFLSLGEKERVARFTARDAKDFWREQTLRPWVLSVCGVFDKAAIVKAAGELPMPAQQDSTLSAPLWGENHELDLTMKDRNQAHLFMVFPTVGSADPDEPGLVLLQNILAGQSGLLFRDLRDKQGLGYTVTAFSWRADKAGALIFYIGTEPDKMAQAEQGFRTILDTLRAEPLPAEELERGKNQMQGDYYRDHQSLASRSGEAAVLTVLGQPLNAARQLVEKAKALTADDLLALSRKYLEPDKAYFVKVLP